MSFVGFVGLGSVSKFQKRLGFGELGLNKIGFRVKVSQGLGF